MQSFPLALPMPLEPNHPQLTGPSQEERRRHDRPHRRAEVVHRQSAALVRKRPSVQRARATSSRSFYGLARHARFAAVQIPPATDLGWLA